MTDVHALSGAYAVDALDDLERARFENHLDACADCRAEVAGLRESAALLAEESAVAPPPDLRGRILADIETIRPLPPVVAAGLDRGRSTRRRFPGVVGGLVAAAAVVIALVVGVTVVTQDDEPARLSATEQVLRADDAQQIEHEFSDGATATVVYSPDLDQAVISTEGMDDPPPGMVYELWYAHEDGMVKAGLMPEAPASTVLLDGEAEGAHGVGITVEPDGGSEEPTSDPIVVFDFEEA